MTRVRWRERIYRCLVCGYQMVRYARVDADDGGVVCWDCERKRAESVTGEERGR